MIENIKSEQIWWRQVQLGEFYNIERQPQRKKGDGQGALYIEIPSSMKRDTFNFLGYSVPDGEAALPIRIRAHVLVEPRISATIEFKSKSGDRLRISNQNRQQIGSMRHPAWTKKYGFPQAPDDVEDRAAAAPFFPDGGLRIYIIRATNGEYYAGFTKGFRPREMQPDDPNWELYENRRVGGVF